MNPPTPTTERLVAALLIVLLVLGAYSGAYIYYRQTHSWVPQGEGTSHRRLAIPTPDHPLWDALPFTTRLPWYLFQPAIWLDSNLTGIIIEHD